MPEEKAKAAVTKTDPKIPTTSDSPSESKSNDSEKKSILDLPYPATEDTLKPKDTSTKSSEKSATSTASPKTPTEVKKDESKTTNAPAETATKTEAPVQETPEIPPTAPVETEAVEPFVTPDPEPTTSEPTTQEPAETKPDQPASEPSQTSTTETPATETTAESSLADLAAKAEAPEKLEATTQETLKSDTTPSNITPSETPESTTSTNTTTTSPVINRDEDETTSSKSKYIKIGLIILVGVIILALVYIGIRFNPFATNPKKLFSPQAEPVTKSVPSLILTLQQPEDELLTFDGSILVSGVTIPNAQVLISTETRNKVIQSKDDGSFSTLMSLDEGVNKLQVTTFDELGTQKSEIRSVYYSEEEI